MELIFTKDDCYMYMKGFQPCSGSINMSVCGFNCPFRKTEEEQREIEKKIVKRFADLGYVGTYRSCIDNKVLYQSNGSQIETFI